MAFKRLFEYHFPMPDKDSSAAAAYLRLETASVNYLADKVEALERGEAAELPQGVTMASIVSLLRAAKQPEETTKNARAGAAADGGAAVLGTLTPKALRALSDQGLLSAEMTAFLGKS